ncbi:PD-(D/E)XK nuclease-like domain-containing protein [Mesorhizobium sp. B1-1-4]|uniref:PD-(D/E)XK nuclease-like domain-containing protein n=1 Tax=Mesorhizobium sp. B1-1-4 TaxID=2589980 RepID=UPI001FF02231|nr:PD-(D/E)XK nuclease-like domain-containing protein [Mesorhizobium sp. B1-1-4]
MSDHIDIDHDRFESLGAITDRIVGRRGERDWNGQPISEPGIYRKIPMDAYHAQLTEGPSISSSGLREIENRSPMHYWATSYLNPDRPEEETSASLDFGRAVHTLLLSEDGFRDDYVVRPETYEDDAGKWKPWSGNANVCKEWLAARRAEGKTVLLKSQLTDIHGMADRLAKNHVAVDLLRGRIERSIITKDTKTGVWVKSRPDSIPRDTIIADLKTCADASQVAISRSIINYGYLQQMALAITCLEEVGQRQVNEAVLLFVETSYPYAFNIKPLDNGDIHTAMRQNRRALNVFADCLKANDWPTYADNTLTWSAPKWWCDRHEHDSTLPELQKDRAA